MSSSLEKVKVKCDVAQVTQINSPSKDHLPSFQPTKKKKEIYIGKDKIYTVTFTKIVSITNS